VTADTTQLERTLVKVAVPLLVTAMVLVVARRRWLSWREELGLAWPGAKQAGLWLAIYVVWMLGSNAIWGWRGPWDFATWAQTPLGVAMLRVLAVGVLGPIAEELVFRGGLYARLIGTRVGVTGAVVLLAAGWAVVHTSYSGGVVALIFVDGLLLGAARYYSRSVVAPILMHVAWNLYAVW